MKKSQLFKILFTSAHLFILFGYVHVKAEPPANKGYVLLFDESFTADTLNTNRWYYREGLRTGTGINGLNLKENVFVKDGMLHVVAKYEKINDVYQNTGGGIITKDDFGYGYYECLSKPFMAGRGVHSAFWQRGSVTPNKTVFEIDSYEIDSKSYMATNNLYYTICPAAYTEYPWPHRANIPFKFNADGWFLDAYERTPEGVIFYDNGKIVAKAEWDELNATQMVWLTALNGVGTVDTSLLPGESLFKYFRYYAKDYPGYNLLPNGNFEFNQDKITASKPVSWVVGGTTDAVSVVKGAASRDNYRLRISKSATFQTTISQKLSYILNGDYTLTAMVRSSGGLAEARIKANDFGGTEVFADITAGTTWTKITIPHIHVSNNKVNIDIVANGTASQWIEIDDINFMKPVLAGQETPAQTAFQTVGEPIWKLAEKEPVIFTGDDSFYFFSRNVGYGDAMSVSFDLTADLLATTTPIARIPKTGDSGWAVQLNEDGSLIFRIGSIANHTDVLTPKVYSAGKTVHVCCVFNKGTALIFIDGNLVRKQTGITQLIKDDTAAGRLGSVGSAYSAVGDVVLPDSTIVNTNTSMKKFKGAIQHLRVYNVAILAEPEADYIKNGGFETTTIGQINWEMNREQFNLTAFNWLKTDPAEKLNSMRVLAVNSSNLFGANLSQKIAVGQGNYLLRFKARATNSLSSNATFRFKFADYSSGQSIMLNDTTPRVVTPTSTWQSYSFNVDLKENFNAKLIFGFSQQATFDMDSISLVRVGNVVSDLRIQIDNQVSVKVVDNRLIITSNDDQHLMVFSIAGQLFISRKISAGENSIPIQQKGLCLVRLWNETSMLTKKIFIG